MPQPARNLPNIGIPPADRCGKKPETDRFQAHEPQLVGFNFGVRRGLAALDVFLAPTPRSARESECGASRPTKTIQSGEPSPHSKYPNTLMREPAMESAFNRLSADDSYQISVLE